MKAQDRFIDGYLSESEAALKSFAADPAMRQCIRDFADCIAAALKRGKKLLIAGNGGSAADAQHIAAEIVSRQFFDRAPLCAIALTTDTSLLTAIGNDFGFEEVFARQLAGVAARGDVFLGISTSGKSANVLRALAVAKTKGLTTLGFTGAKTGPMDKTCDFILHAPSRSTPVIQQIHGIAAHLVCGLVEHVLFDQVGRKPANG